jgi:protein TonB
VPTPAPSPAAAAPRRPTAAEGHAALGGYLGSLSRRVARERHYPPMAIEMGLEGTVEVLVKLGRDGKLLARPALAASSGHELLDKEALRMVEKAAPYPALPAAYIDESAELRVPVYFHLEN